MSKQQQKHILVAEDDAFLADMMRRALTTHGVRVSVAHNGQQAIDSIDADPPDLLLLDLLMPYVDGYGVLMHRNEKKLAFPVIVCSNLSDAKDKSTCKTLGVSSYIVKSDIDDDHLWPVVQKYLT